MKVLEYLAIQLENQASTCTIVDMKLVADTNVFLAVVLDEPEKPRIVELTSGYEVTAPEILPYEIGNALSAMLKRKQLTPEEIPLVFESTQKIPVKLMPPDIRKALDISVAHNIYAYDAYFLQCALSMMCPLITLDEKMKDLAKTLNIKILE